MKRLSNRLRALAPVLATAVAIAVLALPVIAQARPDGAPLDPPAPSMPSGWESMRIVIDPGHGGPYSNSNHYGLTEKGVNLWLGLELQRQLSSAGYQVGMTRTTDRALATSDIPSWHWSDSSDRWYFYKDGKVPKYPPTDDLQARCNVANNYGADVFISIHNNGSVSTSARGTETWAAYDDALGRQLSAYVQKAMIEQTGMPNRGYGAMNLYVVRWANMPAILIEGGFLSNPTDARLMRSSTFRAKLMRGVALGLQRWLATKPFRGLYTRLPGDDAQHVAVSESRTGWTSASTVLLASAAAPLDALAVGPLSRKLGAPLLFAGVDSLDASTAAEIARLSPDQVIVVGGEEAVGPTVPALAAAAAGIDVSAVRRIDGAGIAGTAAAISEEVGLDSRTVVISPVGHTTEALSGGMYAAAKGAPLLLASSATSLGPVTKAFLTAHAGQISRVVVVGHTGAIADSALAGLPSVTRVKGIDRYETNTATMRSLYPSGNARPIIANASRMSDTLAAEMLSIRLKRPMLITGGRTMSPYTRQWISNYHRVVTGFTIVGGYGSQPTLMDWMLNKADH